MAKRSIIICSLLLIFGAGFLPKILSTNSGKKLIENYLSQKLKGEISIEKVKFSWMGPQEYHQIKWTEKDQSTQIVLDKMTSSGSLFSILGKEAHFAINSAQLETGKENPFNQLFALRRSKHTDQEKLKLSAEPLIFSITDGKILLQKTTMMINDSFPLKLWGTIDFAADQLDMTFALTALGVKKAFGIKGLPENYLLEVPVKGNLHKPKFDLKKTMSKVTALMMWQKLSKEESVPEDLLIEMLD